jgi:hypothetical protein
MKSINTNSNIPSPTTILFVKMNPKTKTTSLKATKKPSWGDQMNLSITAAFHIPQLNKLSRPFSPISYSSTAPLLSDSSEFAPKSIKIYKWVLPLSSATFRKFSTMKEKNLSIISQNCPKYFMTKKTNTTSSSLYRFPLPFSRFSPFKNKSKIFNFKLSFIQFIGKWLEPIQPAKSSKN